MSFLFNHKTRPLVQQEDASTASTRRHVSPYSRDCLGNILWWLLAHRHRRRHRRPGSLPGSFIFTLRPRFHHPRDHQRNQREKNTSGHWDRNLAQSVDGAESFEQMAHILKNDKTQKRHAPKIQGRVFLQKKRCLWQDSHI